MADLSTFGSRMRSRGDRIESNATKAKRKVGVAVVTAVVQTTPIDTGRARFWWNVSMNRPNHNYEYESFEGGGRVGDWLGKMATSRVAILRATEKDIIYISNGLPYIGKLNRGYSAQAPRDYVRTASILGAQVVRNSRLVT